MVITHKHYLQKTEVKDLKFLVDIVCLYEMKSRSFIG